MKKKIAIPLYLFIFILLFSSSIIFRKDISTGVIFGINYSLNVLIPSLFPLIFLSSFISFSPLSKVFSKIFSLLTRHVFRLPATCFTAIFFGLTCGYPVGGKLTSTLLANNEITKKEAERLILFVMNPGIPFCVVFIGGGIFRDVLLGFQIFLAITTASVIIGILSGFKKALPPKSSINNEDKPMLLCFNMAATSALKSTCTMCLYIVIFSAFLPLFHSFGIFQQTVKLLVNPLFSPAETAALLSFIGEVTHGVNDAITLHAGALIFAIGLSFGGLCIHFQIFSFFPSRSISLVKFYIARIIHAILTGIVFSCYLFAFPRSTNVFSSLYSFTPVFSRGTVTGSICLIILSCTYIYLANNKRVEKSKFK